MMKSRILGVLLAGVLGCSLAACGRSPETRAAARTPAGSAFTLMQMNLCLSGFASCYGETAYPAVLKEVLARIRAARPDAVTLSEACSGDVALIAQKSGYSMRFSSVVYSGGPLPCENPRGRGLYGDAVLTKAPVDASESHAFEAQAGPERRDWLCVTTADGVEVCTAHLASQDPVEAAANRPQCAELRALLARRAAGRPLVFGGDLNRGGSCAPSGFWVRTDASAHQNPGLQQAYGTRALRSPTAEVVPAVHTDHDVLLVSASRDQPVVRRRQQASGMKQPRAGLRGIGGVD